MELSNVYIWGKDGWRKITVEEARALHPGGTVPAKSGLFMCGYCQQYVTFTDGEKRKRYFRHSKENNAVNCPEYSSRAILKNGNCLKKEDTQFTLKLVIEEKKHNIEIKIGIRKTTEEDKYSISVKGSDFSKKFIYSSNRFSSEGVTYVPAGDIPSENYLIEYESLNIRKSMSVDGIRKEGSLFDGRTMKLLPEGSDVKIGRKYYLLTKNNLDNEYFPRVCLHKLNKTS